MIITMCAGSAAGGSLQFCFPRGFSDLIRIPPWGWYVPNYGLTTSPAWAVAENRQQLTGDFDVAVDFTQYQGKTGFGSLTAALYVSPTPFEQATGPQYDVAQYDLDVFANNTCAFIGRDNTPQYHAGAIVNGTAGTDATAATSDTSGKVRIQRSGSTVTMYYWNAGTSSWSVLASYAGYSTAASYVALYFRAQNGGGSVGFQNFGYTGGSPAYPSSGTYTSAISDAGRSVSWTTLDWTAQTPGTSAIKFQVAVSSASLGPWTYVGPDGTSGTYFTTSPATLPTLTGRYFRYQATLTGDGTVTPTLSAASAAFSGTNASTVRSYSYDGAGNMTEKITTTPTGSPTSELRDHPSWPAADRVNHLNQILRNDVATGVLEPFTGFLAGGQRPLRPAPACPTSPPASCRRVGHAGAGQAAERAVTGRLGGGVAARPGVTCASRARTAGPRAGAPPPRRSR